MKKLVTFLFFIFHFSFFISFASAQTPTKTPTPTATKEEMSPQPVLDTLRERIASRVAQLKLVEKRGIMGTVSERSGTEITMIDLKGSKRIIDVDEFTRFASPSAKESFGISDIEKGSKLGIVGLFNKQSERILARFVDTLVLPFSIHGVIIDVDSEDFSFTTLDEKGKQMVVDVETITKTSSYSKEDGLARAGFSKISQGAHVIVIGFPDVKNDTRLTGLRILLFPDIPPNPRINIPQEALDKNTQITPSTGSGKKLTPITR